MYKKVLNTLKDELTILLSVDQPARNAILGTSRLARDLNYDLPIVRKRVELVEKCGDKSG